MTPSTSKRSSFQEAKERSRQRRLEKGQEFAHELVDKLGDKVVCVVVWGSVSRGEHTSQSDIDTFVMLDDTKLEQDVPQDVQEKIRYKVIELAKKIDSRITLQYFAFLTEFWDQLRNGEPLAIDVLRLGVPVYDIGVFGPAKRLLQRGRIYATREAVHKRMGMARMTFQKMENQLRHSIPFHLEQAVTSAAQSPVMLLGRTPPGKFEIASALEDLFVKSGLLEQKYADMAKELNDFADTAEKQQETITGQMVEEHIAKADEFIKRMDALVKQLGERQKIQDLLQDYKVFLRANVAALKSHNITPPQNKEDLPQVMEEHFALDEDQKQLFERWDQVLGKIREKKEDELEDQEIYQLRTDTRHFINEMSREAGGGQYSDQQPEAEQQDLPDDVKTQMFQQEMTQQADQQNSSEKNLQQSTQQQGQDDTEAQELEEMPATDADTSEDEHSTSSATSRKKTHSDTSQSGK